jgi:hypothetical protein
MDGLERHRGHFYNWYDTQTLQPLVPLYISTVDSGNLAGHLLTLRAGLLALGDDRILPARLFDGLGDTLRLLLDAMEDPEAGAAPALRKILLKRPMDYDFLFDKTRRLLSDRLQRRRTPARRRLLRPAGLGSAAVQFRRHRPGPVAAGELVRPRAPADQRRRRAGAAVVERLDVRVPDAAAGDADLRQHAARPDLQGGGGAADRLRQAARRALGHFESGYNTVDAHLNYQYRAFGVPGLGLKRGLADDLVIAPYASALALMVAPEEACQNLQRLAADGIRGPLRLLRGDRLHAGAPARRGQSITPSCAPSWRTTRA